MFEKDAYEYREKGKNEGYYLVTQDMEQEGLDYIIDESFKDGAEFGYNKAIEELKQAKKLLEKWLFFNGFNSALKKETEGFLGKKTEEIGIPEGVEEIKWQRKDLKNS
mgnify:CR=1 FL=1